MSQVYAQPTEPAAEQDEIEELEIEYFFSSMESHTIGVMEFISGSGIPINKLDIIADVLAEEISRLGPVKVITKMGLAAMQDVEKYKKLTGCTDEECVAELAGALGVYWMVRGNLSAFGDIQVLSLKLIDVKGVRVAGRVLKKIKGGDEELLEALPGVTRLLFSEVADQLGLNVGTQVTVASRHVQPLAQSPSAVTVITREDIETSGASNIPDLLRMVPGMDVVLVTPFFSSISSRIAWTFGNDAYLVLIDGRETNFELMGQPLWAIQPIMIDDIERIEIIRGPGSALYGANALGGVVSITTRAIRNQPEAQVSLQSGDASNTVLNARASAKFGQWGFLFGGGLDQTGWLSKPQELGKQLYRSRAVAEYRWPDNSRLLLDAGMSTGNGLFPTSIGSFDIDYTFGAVRLAYESDSVQAHVNWMPTFAQTRSSIPLDYGQVRLATLPRTTFDSHIGNAEVQWKVPEIWERLLMIGGASIRMAWVASDRWLDRETFANPSSPDYRKPGVEGFEVRTGAFLHAEYAPLDWATITAGTRLDHNTTTGWDLTPRLAAVIRAGQGQFLRLGVARSFRMPAFFESTLHVDVEFPEDSPLVESTQRSLFRDFMLNVLGNPELKNENLWSVEIGYIGRFLQERLTVSLDLYFNRYSQIIELESKIVADELTGLPDLRQSSFMFTNAIPDGGDDRYYLGSELSIQFNLSRFVTLAGSWAYREEFLWDTNQSLDESPKNLITLGGRLLTEYGLLGSLYVHTRSVFSNLYAANPRGILEPFLHVRMKNVALILGRIGFRWSLSGSTIETGLKLMLPIVPGASKPFRYYEFPGGVTDAGVRYGGDELRQVLTGYLQGSF